MDIKNILADLPEDFLNSLPALVLGEDVADDLPVSTGSNGYSRDLARAVQLAKALDGINRQSGMDKWFSETAEYPIDTLPKHAAFFAAGKEYPERLFLAANRVGKTVAGAYEASCHATGIYHTFWAGKRFDGPTDGWACGPDARTVRDTIQKELLGGLGEWGTGMIPANCLGQCSTLQGVPGAVDTVRIKHVSGGWSTIGFKNYKQDIQAFMGTSRHWVWTDEECPIEIWNECNIRTATTNGIMFATFTPLEGLTRMVVNFCKSADFLLGARPIAALTAEHDENETVGFTRKKAVVQAGWDDAAWLSTEIKARLLDDTPMHLRDARSKGIPSMGAGNVFATPIEQVVCDPFSIPDNWPRMYGLDVGWNRTAAIWAALDPNSDTLYFYDEHYQAEQEPHHHAYAIKSRGEWVTGVIDPATRGRSQVDGAKLWNLYKQQGLKLFLAKNEREAGIQALSQRFSTGKAKVFRTLANFQKEYMLYRRDQRGRVMDEDDHLMDACFDEQTEVMTLYGFKPWASVTMDDQLATVNLDSNNLEYQKPLRLIDKDWEGDMIFFNNKAQQLVTPDHNMVVYRRNTNYKKPELVPASEVTVWDKLKHGGLEWQGTTYTPPIENVEGEVFAEFLGWYIAEGSLLHPYSCNPHRYGVSVAQIKTEGRARLEELFKDMPGAWNYCSNGYQCTSKQLYSYLEQFGLSGNKYVPQEIKNASQNIIAAFLKGYIAGDGWVQGKGVASASVSKRLTDDVQELFLKVGKTGNVLFRKALPYNIQGRTGTNTRDQWWFVENAVPTAQLRDSKNKPNFKSVQYTGKVYCATVPNGTLVVRRNGKISVSGNCRYVVNNMIRMSSKTQLGIGAGMNIRPTIYDI